MSKVFEYLYVSSFADGTMRIEPDYCDEYLNEDGECDLGFLDRMAIARAIEDCLKNHIDVLNLRLTPVREDLTP